MFFSEYIASVTHLGTADRGLEAAAAGWNQGFLSSLGFSNPLQCFLEVD